MGFYFQCGLILISAFLSANADHLKSAANKIYIGAAITPSHFSESNYKTVAGQEFNCLTPENEMKFDAVERTKGMPNYSQGDQLVEFAHQNQMKVRGHTLIWHSQLPGWVQSLNKTDLESTFKKHITDEMTHYKGKIYAWDVVNEAFEENGNLRDSVWHKNLGNNFIAEAFKIAHAADPNAKLYYNDYNIESKNSKSDGVYKLVSQLKAQGVPIHGVGFQSHFISGAIPHDLTSNLERFAALGLDVAITELDIRIQSPTTPEKLAKQATEYASVFKSCLSVSRCVGVTIWGVTDKYSWVPNVFHGYGDALIFDNNYHAKPAVAAIEAALK